jgi:hypothetical protein
MELGATDTLAVAQGAGGEALEDEDEDIVYEDGHFGSSCWGPPPPSSVLD